MTRNADARVVLDASPCDGCANRRICADLSDPKACNAYELFEEGKPAREWRDAARIPFASIGRGLVIRWHGKAAVNQVYPLRKVSQKP